MYLSYSGYKKYLDCPYVYWHSYVNETPLEKPEDRLGSVFGSTVGLLFEDFYNQRFWKQEQPQAFVMERVGAATARIIKQETSPRWGRPGGVLLWKGDGEGQNPRGMYVDRDELMADVRDAVRRGFQIIKHYRLLGPYAEAEVKLDKRVEGHTLGGRADFILKRTKPHHDRCVLDGKGSKYRDRYVSPKQLLWYGMLYWLCFDKVPDKLGFVYWRYAPPDSLDWLDFSEADLDQLLEEALGAVETIERLTASLPAPESDIAAIDRMKLARGVFKPKANENNCRFCPYATATQCSWGFSVRQKMEQSRRG